MADPAREVETLLKEHHAQLVRTKRHFVWEFPDGRIFTQACTPSDVHAASNQLRDLRRTLGLTQSEARVGQRRERSVKTGRTATVVVTLSASSAILDATRKTGLVEERLNDKIAALTLELRKSRRANTRRRMTLQRMDQHCLTCWGCRLARWVRKTTERLFR